MLNIVEENNMEYIAVHLVSESSDHYTFCLDTDFSPESIEKFKSDVSIEDTISEYYWDSFSMLSHAQMKRIEDALDEVRQKSWE